MGRILSSSSATVFVAAERSHKIEPEVLVESCGDVELLLNAGAVGMSGAARFCADWLCIEENWGNAGTKDIALTDIDCCCWLGFLKGRPWNMA